MRWLLVGFRPPWRLVGLPMSTVTSGAAGRRSATPMMQQFLAVKRDPAFKGASS
jgi:hypothetical protein